MDEINNLIDKICKIMMVTPNVSKVVISGKITKIKIERPKENNI